MVRVKEVVLTGKSQPPLGPYSQVVRVGELLFISGQTSRDPEGRIRSGDVRLQTRQVLSNLKVVVEAARG